jgi:hypothetical protein
MTSDYVGQDVLEPDQYLGPKRYRIRARCTLCEKEYHWITTRLDGSDRPCPKKKCREAIAQAEAAIRQANLQKMLDEQRPPGHIGHNLQTKAIDLTADIVMQDYQLTDLKDGIRHGETMAPKLPPAQQQAADNFFSGPPTGNSRLAQRMNRRVRSALAGGAQHMSVNPTIVGPPPEIRLLNKDG